MGEARSSGKPCSGHLIAIRIFNLDYFLRVLGQALLKLLLNVSGSVAPIGAYARRSSYCLRGPDLELREFHERVLVMWYDDLARRHQLLLGALAVRALVKKIG